MKPETQAKIDALQKQIDNLRSADDVVFSESLKRRVFQDIIETGVVDTTLTGINETTTVGAGGGNVNHNTPYDRRIRIVIDGQPYYLGLYDI